MDRYQEEYDYSLMSRSPEKGIKKEENSEFGQYSLKKKSKVENKYPINMMQQPPSQQTSNNPSKYREMP